MRSDFFFIVPEDKQRLLLMNQVEDLIAGPLILQENSAEGRSGREGIGLLDASDLHASMGRFDHHGNSQRLQRILDAVEDLHGQPFLYLESPGKSLDNASNLAQTGNRTVRNVSDMRFTDERHQMICHAEKEAPDDCPAQLFCPCALQ